MKEKTMTEMWVGSAWKASLKYGAWKVRKVEVWFGTEREEHSCSRASKPFISRRSWKFSLSPSHHVKCSVHKSFYLLQRESSGRAQIISIARADFTDVSGFERALFEKYGEDVVISAHTLFYSTARRYNIIRKLLCNESSDLIWVLCSDAGVLYHNCYYMLALMAWSKLEPYNSDSYTMCSI